MSVNQIKENILYIYPFKSGLYTELNVYKHHFKLKIITINQKPISWSPEKS